MKSSIIADLKKLKKEKNATILAHYYVNKEIQEAADYVGDSFFLAKKAKELDSDILVMAGVYFMGESAKILNPDKKVILPEPEADCPMAHMVTVEDIEKMRSEYDDLCVVTYVNSTAEIKAYSDVCVTSSNAVQIVNNLDSNNIYFIPDKNLGHFVKKQVPNKNIIFNDGYCPIHNAISVDDSVIKEHAYPILAHPECPEDVLSVADYIGSTSGIIAEAEKYDKMIIATEEGIFTKLKNLYPDKTFYRLENIPICEDMKKNTLEKLYDALLNEKNVVEIDPSIAKRALIPLERMLEMTK